MTTHLYILLHFTAFSRTSEDTRSSPHNNYNVVIFARLFYAFSREMFTTCSIYCLMISMKSLKMHSLSQQMNAFLTTFNAKCLVANFQEYFNYLCTLYLVSCV